MLLAAEEKDFDSKDYTGKLSGNTIALDGASQNLGS
jgi:hypothetical protein